MSADLFGVCHERVEADQEQVPQGEAEGDTLQRSRRRYREAEGVQRSRKSTEKQKEKREAEGVQKRRRSTEKKEYRVTEANTEKLKETKKKLKQLKKLRKSKVKQKVNVSLWMLWSH